MITPVSYKLNVYNFSQNLQFHGTKESAKDSFERQNNIQDIDFRIYDPYSMKDHSSFIQIDLSKPQKFQIEDKNLRFDYDPQRNDYLWDKVKNKPIKVNILKSEKAYDTVFHFMSPDLTHHYGYTHISKCMQYSDYQLWRVFDDLVKDYPEQGIVGPRVIVEYTQNWNDKKVGGVGRLADKVAVKYCMDNDIDLNIISFADKGSHVAHYKRGKRFMPIDSDRVVADFYKSRYGSSDINEILKNLIIQSEKTGRPVNISGWGMRTIYMPKEIAQKYVEEIESENCN